METPFFAERFRCKYADITPHNWNYTDAEDTADEAAEAIQRPLDVCKDTI